MTVKKIALINSQITSHADDLRQLNDEERARAIISEVQVDGTWVTISQYSDDIWKLTGGTTNRTSGHKQIDFKQVPMAFQAVTKEVMYRYLRRGREGSAKPSTTTIFSTFSSLLPFLRYLDTLKLNHLSAVTSMVCSLYVAACRAERQPYKKGNPPISAGTLDKRLSVVEMLHELSQFTATPMLSHPWPDSSAMHLAGLTGQRRSSKTPLIPDDVFSALFQEAWILVQDGNILLDQREELDQLATSLHSIPRHHYKKAMNHRLEQLGWKGGLRKFTATLNELRTACYIVIASLSGCRNHELAYVQNGAYYSSEDDEGQVYWWMKSRSDKTGEGATEWMIPEAAVEALRIMERWAAPYQAKLAEEIAHRRAANSRDTEISEAHKHEHALFLKDDDSDHHVRTLSNAAWNIALREFSKRRGINWHFTTHQFRRKFANYAARSKFGDLRYLREHFKHWSQDMTNDSYALNDSQEMELYAEIQDELNELKLGLVERWVDPAEPLAGNYGSNLVSWRSRDINIALFKNHKVMVRSIAESHAIRSNGHAWCTADDNKCLGNSFEVTRCGGCDNAVIDRSHARLYQRLYDDLTNLAKCDDIGLSGQMRVRRDTERCRDVLKSLGLDPEPQSV